MRLLSSLPGVSGSSARPCPSREPLLELCPKAWSQQPTIRACQQLFYITIQCKVVLHVDSSSKCTESSSKKRRQPLWPAPAIITTVW